MTARHTGADAAMRAVALTGIRSGRSMREIAIDFYGAERVAAGWHRDSGMRAKVRRLVHRARRIGRGAGQRRPRNAMTTGNDTGRVSGRRQGETSVTETGDGALAWMVLRQVGEYREAWRRHAASVGASAAPEPGPFVIRIQTEADLEAERFEMLSREDQWNADGPASAFWRQGGMPEGVLEPGAEPLVGLVGDRGSVEGLRLLGGGLVLKIEYGGAAVQIGLGDVARFPGDGTSPGGSRPRHPTRHQCKPRRRRTPGTPALRLTADGSLAMPSRLLSVVLGGQGSGAHRLARPVPTRSRPG